MRQRRFVCSIRPVVELRLQPDMYVIAADFNFDALFSIPTAASRQEIGWPAAAAPREVH